MYLHQRFFTAGTGPTHRIGGHLAMYACSTTYITFVSATYPIRLVCASCTQICSARIVNSTHDLAQKVGPQVA